MFCQSLLHLPVTFEKRERTYISLTHTLVDDQSAGKKSKELTKICSKFYLFSRYLGIRNVKNDISQIIACKQQTNGQMEMTLSIMQLYFVPPSYGRSGAHGWYSTGWGIAIGKKRIKTIDSLACLICVPVFPNALNLTVVIPKKYLPRIHLLIIFWSNFGLKLQTNSFEILLMLLLR